MIYYTADSRDIFISAVQIDPYAPLPKGSLTAPPETSGTEVAQLAGSEWTVLPEYPPEPPPTREALKAVRAASVDNIKVTTAAGNTFDGDEVSQGRMARAVLVLPTGFADTVPWVLADNTVIQASAAELTEALALAGAEQARLWVLP